jgi:putative ABC transport system ATP-binding protein
MTLANPAPALELENVSKNYHGLRPLRLGRLVLARGQRLAISGLDAAAAEVLVELITGAALPDQGTICIYGRRTTDIDGSDAWLAWLDQFGIVSHRAVLLEGSTVAQNLALPFTLDIDPIEAGTLARVRTLAAETAVGGSLDAPVAGLSAASRMKIHLGRALALDPALLLLEHPTVNFAKGEARAFGELVAGVAKKRSLPVLTISDDVDLTRAVAERRFTLEPATGALSPTRRWF